ncbi:uncharacterized protein L3040_001979 [Drepanopeziza brunnea f. sp. 'multigermtubi']|uniref:uncharacterized protein n=1 Tax=Drepanopeziza brunnea f. sp. 'multigermtubi' TaxID=698441 RepID=UPI0023914969|nr:hypothetical protein L3040_001979 [Drepanopeziza brunnea f. sp. 'multigermtubi']
MDDILTVEREIETDNHDEMPILDQEFVQETSHEELLERGTDELSYEGENPSRSFDGFHNLENERDTPIPPVHGNVDVSGPPEYLGDESLLPGDLNGGRSAISIQKADSGEIVADEDEQVPTDDFGGGHDLEESELVEDEELSVVLIPVQDDEHDAAVSKGTDLDHESPQLSIEHADSKGQNQLDLDATVSEISHGRIVGEEASYKPLDEEQYLSDSEMPPEKAIRPRGLPLAGLDAEPFASPFTQSPINTSSRDAHLNSETSDDFIPTPAPSRDVNLDDEPQAAPNFDPPSLFPPTHQIFTNQNLDSGHATPLDEAQSNPFDDSDNLASPSDALSPQSVLSPEVEIDAPNFEQYAPIQHQQPPYHDGFRTHESENSAPPPSFPSFPGMTPLQQHARHSEDVLSPTSEYGSPGFQAPRVRTPVQAQHFQPPVFEDSRAETPTQGRQLEVSSRDFTPEFERRAVGPSEPTGGARPMYDSDDDQPPISRRELPAFPQVQQRASVFSDFEQQEPAQQIYDSDDDQPPVSRRELPAFPQVQQRASVFSDFEQQEPAQQIYDSDDDQPPTSKRELPAFPQVQQRASVFSDFEQRGPAQQMYGSEDGQDPGSEIRRPTFQQNKQSESAFSNFELRGPAQQIYGSEDGQDPGSEIRRPNFQQNKQSESAFSNFEQRGPAQQIYGSEDGQDQGSEIRRPNFQQNQQRESVFPDFDQRGPVQQMYESHNDQTPDFRRELSTSSQARQNAPVQYDNDSDYAQSPELERRAPVFPSFGQQLLAQQMDEPQDDQSLNFRRELSTSSQARQNAPVPYDNDSDYAQSPELERRAPDFPSFGQQLPAQQMDEPRDDESLNFRRELSTSSQARQNALIQSDNDSDYAQSPELERRAPVFPSFGQQLPAQQMDDPQDDQSLNFRRELSTSSQARQNAPIQSDNDSEYARSPELERRALVFPSFGQPVPEQMDKPRGDESLKFRRELSTSSQARQNAPIQSDNDSEYAQSPRSERHAPVFPSFGQPAPEQIYDSDDDDTPGFRREPPQSSQAQQGALAPETYDSDRAQSPELQRRIPLLPNFGQPVPGQHQQTYDADEDRHGSLERELPAFPGLDRQQTPAGQQNYDSADVPSTDIERRAPIFPNFRHPVPDQQIHDARSQDFRRELPSFPGLGQGQQPSAEERTYGSSEAQSPEFERHAPVFPNFGQSATAQPIYDSDDNRSPEFRRELPAFPGLSLRQQPSAEERTYGSSEAQSPESERRAPVFPNFGQPATTQQMYDSDDNRSPDLRRELPAFPGLGQQPPAEGRTHSSGEAQSPELERRAPVFPDLGQPATAQRIYDESDDEDSARFQQNSQGFPELSSRQPLQPAYDSDGRLPEPRVDIASFPDVRQQPPTQQYDSDDGPSSEDEWDQSPGFQRPIQTGATQPAGYDDLRSHELGAYRPDSTQQDLRPTSPDLRRPADDSYGGFGSEQRYDAPAFPNIGRRSRSPLRTLEADEVRSRDSETNAAARDLPTMPLRLPRRPFEEDLDDQNNENDFRPRDLDAYARAPAFPDLGRQASTSSPPLDDPAAYSPEYERDAAYSREYEREEAFPDSRAHHFDEDEFRPRGLDFHQPPPPPRPLFQAQQFDTSSSSHSGLPAHLQLNVPATTPLFTDRRQRSSEHPFEDEEATSPSSEFAVPITPGLARNAAPQSQFRDFPAGPSFSDLRTGPPAGFGSREDTAFADFGGTGARSAVESRTENHQATTSALQSPTSSVFSEGGEDIWKSEGAREGREGESTFGNSGRRY